MALHNASTVVLISIRALALKTPGGTSGRFVCAVTHKTAKEDKVTSEVRESMFSSSQLCQPVEWRRFQAPLRVSLGTIPGASASSFCTMSPRASPMRELNLLYINTWPH